MKIRYLFRYLLWSLLVILSVLIGVLGFALATETGLKAVLAVAERVLPGTLTYDRIEGRLIGPLQVDTLRYQDGELGVNLEEAEFNWYPSGLLSGRLHVDVLKTDGLELHLPPPAPEEEPVPSEPLQLSELPLPLELEITDLAVTDTRIWPHGAEQPVVIDSVVLQAGSEGRAINLRTLKVNAPQGDVSLNGRLELAGAIPLTLHLNGTYEEPQYGPLKAEGTVRGQLNETLSLNFDVSGPLTANLEGEASQVLNDLGWQARLTLTAPDLGKFVPDLAGRELSAKLQTQGSVDTFKVNGELDTSLPEVGPVAANFKLSGSPEEIQLSELALNAAESPMSLTAKAEVNLTRQLVDASGRWQSLMWPLTGTPQVESPQGEFTLTGSLQDYKLAIETALTGPDFGNLNAEIQATGSDQAVKLSTLSLRAPDSDLALNLQGNVSFADLAFQASGQWRSLAWPLTGEPQVQSPQGQLSAQGTPQDYQLRLQADLSSTEAGDLKALIEATGSDQAVKLSTLSLQAPDGDLALTAQGELSFADLSFQASGEWQSLAWPLIGTPQVQSPSGTFKASGNIKDYEFQLNTRVQGQEIPESEWSLQGQGSDQAVQDLALEGRLLEGELKADISATWQPTVSWQVDLSGRGLNPGVQWPDIPGKLALQLQTQGSLTDGQLQATADLEQLSGNLAGQELKGQAQVAVENQDVTIQTLQLNAGNAELTASGSLAQRWALQWNLQVPSLTRLLPAAAGTISSSGSVQGPREKPQAQLRLAVDNLAFGETTLQRLQGEANVDISGATRSQLSFTGSGLGVAGQTWQSLSLRGSGTPSDHTLQTALAGDLGRFELALAGSFNEQSATWRGRLTQLSAQNTQVGDWRLSAPMPLQVSAQRAIAEQSCLVSSPTRICIQGRWDAQTGAEGRVSLENLNFERFADVLPEDIKINTSLSGEAMGESRPDGSVQGTVSLRLSPGNLVLQTNGSSVPITLAGGEVLQARSNGKDATAQLKLNLGNIGQVNANVQINDLPGQGRLNGTVNANVRDLAPVSVLAPQVDNVSGQIVADINLSGTLTAPTIGGAVRLQDAAVDIPEFATRIREIRFAAVSDGRGVLQLSGFARSGPGELQLSGRLQPIGGELDLTIKGNKFEIADSPEIQALVSPDLSLSVTKEAVRVEGRVVITEARVSPAGSGGSVNRVSTSPDVVIVREASGREPESKTAGPAIYAKVRVILEKVTVAAFDFQGRLKGNLLIEQTPRLAPRGSGSVEVESGEYFVYGQRLNIERGRVLFSNSPLDNPGLDLEVTRRIDVAAPIGGASGGTDNDLGQNIENVSSGTTEGTIVAGARVTGTLRNPRLNLFSEPPMPDGTILSYLVLGRPPERAGAGSLTLGRYLSPDLYVGYAVALGEAANTFLMRYKLTEKLTVLATSTDDATGADLLYTIELR